MLLLLLSLLVSGDFAEQFHILSQFVLLFLSHSSVEYDREKLGENQDTIKVCGEKLLFVIWDAIYEKWESQTKFFRGLGAISRPVSAFS